MNNAYERLKPYLERAMAFQSAKILFEWDNETLAPREAEKNTTRVVGILSGEYFNVVTDPQVKELVRQCKEETDSLTQVENAVVQELAEEMEKLECIPKEEYRQFAELTARATGIWARAKKDNDFESFAPVLKEIVEYTKKFASYRAKEGQRLYDVMLEDYEKGFDVKTLDRFFQTLKDQLVPFLKKLRDR